MKKRMFPGRTPGIRLLRLEEDFIKTVSRARDFVRLCWLKLAYEERCQIYCLAFSYKTETRQAVVRDLNELKLLRLFIFN